jgi:23S rRNA-/tRNA-specific pseudouridylate synthase
MTCVCVSSSTALPLLLPRSCRKLLQPLLTTVAEFKLPCFSSTHSRTKAPKVFNTLFAANNEEPSFSQSKRRINESRRYSSVANARSKLERPEIIFSNNHLLVVNKPPGWKSQPGNGGGSDGTMQDSSGPDPKCLLTYLQSQSYGGGSKNDFLMPTHRLDQPCTGVLIFAKNGKAASRVQVAWSKRKVMKCYWVVVEGGSLEERRSGKLNGLDCLISRSIHLSDTNSYQLSAILQNSGGKNGGNRADRSKNAGGSVIVKALGPDRSSDGLTNNGDGRICHIEWRHLLTLPATKSSSNTRHLLSVTTDTGAKHQVRALLGLAGGTPIAGDLRYGNNHNSQYYANNSGHQQGRVDRPLPDGSVALHARSVFLQTVSLGGMEFLETDPFVASIPKLWRDFFGICEDDVRRF